LEVFIGRYNEEDPEKRFDLKWGVSEYKKKKTVKGTVYNQLLTDFQEYNKKRIIHKVCWKTAVTDVQKDFEKAVNFIKRFFSERSAKTTSEDYLQKIYSVENPVCSLGGTIRHIIKKINQLVPGTIEVRQSKRSSKQTYKVPNKKFDVGPILAAFKVAP